jgi:hypothetical protein
VVHMLLRPVAADAEVTDGTSGDTAGTWRASLPIAHKVGGRLPGARDDGPRLISITR